MSLEGEIGLGGGHPDAGTGGLTVPVPPSEEGTPTTLPGPTFVVRWQSSPLPGRVLAFMFADGQPLGFLTFSQEHAEAWRDTYGMTDEGWPYGDEG